MNEAERVQLGTPQAIAAWIAADVPTQRAIAKNRTRLWFGAKKEPYTRAAIAERDGWMCQLCQQPIDPLLHHRHPKSLVVDHIVPLGVGGDDTPVNVQAAHYSCNAIKSAAHLRYRAEDYRDGMPVRPEINLAAGQTWVKLHHNGPARTLIHAVTDDARSCLITTPDCSPWYPEGIHAVLPFWHPSSSVIHGRYLVPYPFKTST